MTWTLEAEHPMGDRLTIRRYVLDNGLSTILLADPAAPVFSYQTWFRVGSRHEQPGKTGMAHFFEHLMFGETANHPAGEFDRLIEERGGDNNAATWNDWTFYRTSLPAADLELAVTLESDRMRDLVLEKDQIETERDVVMNERKERVEDDVDGYLDERLNQLAFTAHPYHWPTIGWMDDIRGLARSDIHAFYRTYYTPNNATLVIVGDVVEQSALDLIARHYGDMPSARIPSEAATIEPTQTSERRESVTRPVSADRLVMGYKVPGQSDPDWLIADFIAALLCGGPSTRLYRRLVVETELASSLDCGIPPFRDPCLFNIGVSMARDRDTDQAIAEIDAAVAALAVEPVPEDELARIKNCVETDFWSALQDCDGKAEALGHYQTTVGNFAHLFELADRLRAITADDVMRVAGTYLIPERRTLVTAEPGESDDSGDGGDA